VLYGVATFAVVLPWFVAFRDIRLSAKVMLGMELASVALIVVLAAGIFWKFGFHVYHDQFHLKDVTPGSFCTGLVIAIFCFVGFESATALGEEAKNPLRTIPRAVVLSLLIVGFFYTMMSFAEVGGFTGYETPLDQSDFPFTVLSQRIGMRPLAPLLGIGALISGLGCILACLNAGSRVMFAMGRHGIFYGSVGGAHKKNETPHVAVTLASVVLLAITLVMFRCKFTAKNVLDLASTFATFGFLLVYILISLAAPVYLKRRGRLGAKTIIVSVLGVLFMMIPVVGSFYPLPDAPLRYIPYIFALYILVGVGWMIYQKANSSGIVEKISRDLEGIGSRFGEAKGIVAEAQGAANDEAHT
jgi:amino acid transporter